MKFNRTPKFCLHTISRGRRHVRSRSLPVTRTMASSPDCTCSFCKCCFLNHISSLRRASEKSADTGNNVNKQTPYRVFEQRVPTREAFDALFASSQPKYDEPSDFPQRSIKEKSAKSLDQTRETFDVAFLSTLPNKPDCGDLSDFPVRLIEKKSVKSSDTFVVVGAAGESCTNTKYTTGSYRSAGSALARKISLVLNQQKQFLKSLNVSLNDDGSVKVDDSDDVTFTSHDRPQTDHVTFYARGDEINVSVALENKRARKILKKDDYSKRDRNQGKEYLSLDDSKVKMLYFPENEVKPSCSSVGGREDSVQERSSGTGSSGYVTAANSRSEEVGRAMFAAADRLCRADSGEVFKID